MKSIDDLFIEIGGFGRYQRIVIPILLLIPLETGINILTLIFTSYSPKFTCSNVISNTSLLNNRSQPEDICDFPNITEDCTEWDFDKSVMRDSIVTQFNLVCDKKLYVATAKTVSMCGLLFGVLSTSLADKFGRKKVLLISLILTLCANIVSTFSPNYMVFIISRFFISACCMCLHTVSFILAVELIPSSYSFHIANAYEFFFTFGLMALTAVAYALRERQNIELSITGFGIIMMILCLKLPESPRWLYARQRTDEADAILHKIAKTNGLKFDTSERNDKSIKMESNDESYREIFSHFKLSMSAIVLYFCWFTVALVYYGLTFIVGSLNGNFYWNSFLTGLVVLPVAIVAPLIAKYFGRKPCLILPLILAGLTLLSSVFVPSDLHIVRTVIGMIGKSLITFAFIFIYLYTGEFYPTSIRATGFAVSSMIARIGAASAPYILEADPSNMIGLIIFGCVSLISGLLMIFPSETKDQPMPQVIEDCLKREQVKLVIQLVDTDENSQKI